MFVILICCLWWVMLVRFLLIVMLCLCSLRCKVLILLFLISRLFLLRWLLWLFRSCIFYL